MSKKILIIEDEQALADVLEAKLKKEGYDVSVCMDGESGYDKINSWKPDIVLLDIVMPKMNGYEVLEKMRDEKVKVPVIIISNSGQPVEIEKTKQLGAIDHLIKTQFEPQEVITKVKKFLEAVESGLPKPLDTKDVKVSGKGGAKVLLVEDDQFLRDICTRKLAKEGFEVHEAMDGEQALSNIEAIKPDIVLLDIILPAIDGFQVLANIRSNKDKKIAQVPIIMLSNLGQESDIEKAKKLGANDYLVKAHFTTDEIAEKIKKLLDLKS